MREGTERYAAAVADLSGVDLLRYRFAMLMFDIAGRIARVVVPQQVQDAAEASALDHTLGFERRSGVNTEDGRGNVYVFEMPDGRIIECDPGTTVSELQNRI